MVCSISHPSLVRAAQPPGVNRNEKGFFLLALCALARDINVDRPRSHAESGIGREL